MIIGLTGFARSGKDSVAKALKLRHGFERVALADNLKQLALAADPLVRRKDGEEFLSLRYAVSLYGWEWAKENTDAREFLQRLGTDGVRQIFGPDAWTRAATPAVLDAVQSGHGVAVTDIRFLNEAEWVRSLGGIVVRVHRPGVGPVNGHTSDNELTKIVPDATILNDSTIQELGKRASQLVEILQHD